MATGSIPGIIGLLGAIDNHKKQAAQEQFASNLMQIINSPDADNIKQTAILNLVKTPVQKTGILESLGGLIDMVNPGAPYRGNVATESPILQHLMAQSAGQIFRTSEDKEKLALDIQDKRQSNLSGMLYNRAMASADNSGLNIPDFNNFDYTRPESIFNPATPNQENGMRIAGKGRLIPTKIVDEEKRAADIDWKRSQTEKNRREIIKPPSVSLQEWDMLTDEEKADRARVKAGLKPKAISPEEQEYRTLRNEKLKREAAWQAETDPIKRKTMEKNLALIGEKLDSFGQTSEKDIWVEYAKLTNRKIVTKKADGSTETRYLVPTDAEINSFNESFADSGKQLVKKMAKPESVKKSIWGDTKIPAQYEYVLEDVGGGTNTEGQTTPENFDATYEALPSGTEFIAPDGTRRRKP